MTSFADYLESKFALDARSINSQVWRQFITEMSGRPSIDLMDIGSGTGALLRRILDLDIRSNLRLSALDQAPELLEIADSKIAELMTRKGYSIECREQGLTAHKDSHHVEFQRQCTHLATFAEDCKPARYDILTAHAFMDLVPLPQAVGHFHHWLRNAGILYCTINYDGETTLFPSYPDPAFERKLLQGYNDSMEKRRLDNHATGGAYCGRRLYAQLETSGFEILGYGSSDWNIVPEKGRYLDNDGLILNKLLGWIYQEGTNNADIDRVRLEEWFATRKAQVLSGKLGIIVHQLDILARKA